MTTFVPAELPANDPAPVAPADSRVLFAQVENVLRTSGHAELADQLVTQDRPAPWGFVEALRSQAANMRNLGMTGTASSLEDMASRLERSAPTVASALADVVRCALAGRWL